MNKKRPHRDYRIYSKKSKAVLAGFAGFMLLCTLIIILCLAFGGKNGYILKERRYYAIVMDSSSDRNGAVVSAQTLKLRGGAGYIIHDGNYKVLGCVYKSEEELSLVMKRMEDSGYGCEGYVFNITSLKRGKYSPEEKSLIKKAADYFDTLFIALTRIYEELDRGNLSEAQGKEKLNNLVNETDKGLAAYGELRYIAGFFEEIKKDIYESANSINANLLSSEVKSILIDGVLGYINLVRNLNNGWN